MMKKLALFMSMLMAVTAVLTPSVAAETASETSSEPKIVYFEDFSSTEYNGKEDAELLSELGWTPSDGATAKFSVNTEGQLIVDNAWVEQPPKGNVLQHSNYLILSKDAMKDVVKNSYTIQMDVMHLKSNSASYSYLAILFNYTDAKNFTMFSTYATSAVKLWQMVKGNSGPTRKLDADGSTYEGNSYNSCWNVQMADRIFGKTPSSDEDMLLLTFDSNMRVRIEVDTANKIARVFINNIYITATDSTNWDTYFAESDGSAVGIRTTQWGVKVELDNIFVATGCPVDKNLEAVTVTFDANGGTCATDKVTVLKGGTIASSGSMSELPTPTKSGYEFVGWKLESGAAVPATFENDTKLVAQWNEISTPIAIKFDTTFTDISIQDKTINKGDSLSANDLPKPEKDGYRFVGWALNDSVIDAEPVVFKTDETLVAQWVETVKVTLSLGGGTFDGDTEIIVDKGTLSSAVTLPGAAEVAKEDHMFVGWATIPEKFESNVTLVAQWKPVEKTTYLVTFNSDGGSAVAAQTIEAGKLATEPDDPTKTGFIFAGWYNGNALYDFNTPVNGKLTLTAKWETPTVVYAQTFNDLPTDLTDAALLNALGWTAGSGATAKFSLDYGKLIVDNNVAKPKHSNYLIRTQEEMASLVGKTYTIQMDVEILDQKNTNSNFALLFNYVEENDYSGGALVPMSGKLGFQQYYLNKKGKIDTLALGEAQNVNLVELLPADTQWGPSDKPLQGVALRLRVEVDTNEARIYVNNILVNKTTAEKWNTYFDGSANAFGIRLTQNWIKVAVDNIIVATGIGIPADYVIPENPKPVVEQTTGINSLLFALAARFSQRFDVLVSAEHCTVSGDMTIKYKRSGTVELAVEDGYQIVNVIANGESLGAVDQVTFKKVTENPTLVIITEKIPEQVPVE